MSRSDARALLDEQIEALNALRQSAQLAYMMTSALPIVANMRDAGGMASYLAQLAVERFSALNRCLNRAEHWLGRTEPVYVPVPGAEGEHPSACAGASNLLLQVATLTGIEADASDPLPKDGAELAEALTAKIQEHGIPEWVLSAPVETLQNLANVVQAETDAAIARLTREFYSARNAIGEQVNSATSIIAPAEGATEPIPPTDATRAAAFLPRRAAHSADFRSVNWFGTLYTFTANQAACVKVWWEHWEQGTPEVGDDTVLEAADSSGKRINALFNDCTAWGTMIVAGSTKGTHRLQEPKN